MFNSEVVSRSFAFQMRSIHLRFKCVPFICVPIAFHSFAFQMRSIHLRFNCVPFICVPNAFHSFAFHSFAFQMHSNCVSNCVTKWNFCLFAFHFKSLSTLTFYLIFRRLKDHTDLSILPDQTLLKIFSKLDARTLCQISQVNPLIFKKLSLILFWGDPRIFLEYG